MFPTECKINAIHNLFTKRHKTSIIFRGTTGNAIQIVLYKISVNIIKKKEKKKIRNP